MAETVLGRVPSRSYALTEPKIAVSLDVSRVAARKYREACKRAGRVAFWTRAERRAAAFLFALSKPVAPLRRAGIMLAYAVAGCGERLRFAAHGKPFQLTSSGAILKKKPNHAHFNTALSFLAAGVLVFTASIYRVGLEVSLNGESIGYVSSQSVLDESLSAVSLRAGEILGRPYIMSPDIEYRFAVVSKNKLYDSKGVEETLLNSIPDIDRLCVLVVDGEPIAAAWSPNDLQAVLNKILEKYPSTGNTTFVQDVSIQSQLASVSLIREADSLYSDLTRRVREELVVNVSEGETAQEIAAHHGLSADTLRSLNPGVDFENLEAGQQLLVQKAKPFLSIAYAEQISYTEPIPYETLYVDDPDLWLGESKVMTVGVDGEAQVTAIQTSIDGYAPETVVNGSFVNVAPVTEVIANGTRARVVTGTFIRPYSGSISSGFGRRYLFGSYSYHYGIDFAGPIGDPIKASDGGTVVFAGSKSGYGLCVIIDHGNGFKTLYGHCSKLLVEVGQKVGQGELIAKVGNTGRSTGPHVHFEVQVNGVAKNPMNYLKR